MDLLEEEQDLENEWTELHDRDDRVADLVNCLACLITSEEREGKDEIKPATTSMKETVTFRP